MEAKKNALRPILSKHTVCFEPFQSEIPHKLHQHFAKHTWVLRDIYTHAAFQKRTQRTPPIHAWKAVSSDNSFPASNRLKRKKQNENCIKQKKIKYLQVHRRWTSGNDQNFPKKEKKIEKQTSWNQGATATGRASRFIYPRCHICAEKQARQQCLATIGTPERKKNENNDDYSIGRATQVRPAVVYIGDVANCVRTMMLGVVLRYRPVDKK